MLNDYKFERQGLTYSRIRDSYDNVKKSTKYRFERYLDGMIVFNYEGTISDQILFFLLKEASLLENTHIFCSTRPCMSTALINEVQLFSKENKYKLIPHEKNCIVDPQNNHFIETSCNNVSSYLESIYSSSISGTLLHSSIMNELTKKSFKEVNKQYLTYERYPINGFAINAKHNFDSLFVFQGYTPFEIVVCYIQIFKKIPSTNIIPTCYLMCYNEGEQVSIQQIIEEHGDHILNLLENNQ